MDWLDCLERVIVEIDALDAIYGSDESVSLTSEGSRFVVVSLAELEHARSLVEKHHNIPLDLESIPELEIEIQLRNVIFDDTKQANMALRCRFSQGYPEQPASVSVSVDGLNRSTREELSARLCQKAEDFAGQEAIMQLMEEFKELAVESLMKESAQSNIAEVQKPSNSQQDPAATGGFGRRWIWVHHITNSDRRKSIVVEAKGLNLGGYLKSGYPGIIIIEGRASDCDEFVSWVKGNKSRPGGFGRNWGHHVRGHLDFDNVNDRKFRNVFEELDDLAVLGRLCKERKKNFLST